MPRPPDANLMKCRYCDWTTMRFRGKQTYDYMGRSYGERTLRMHVVKCHWQEYMAAQGITTRHTAFLWSLDSSPRLDEAPVHPAADAPEGTVPCDHL